MQTIITPAGLARQTSQGKWNHHSDPTLRSPNQVHHLDFLNEHLMRVAAGFEPRSIVTLPPRHGKSELISHYFPVWYLGTFPHKNIILTSYSASLAAQFGEDARNTLKVFGPKIFGVKVDPNHEARDDWQTTDGGGMLSTGVGGSITGRNADLIIVDDPIKDDQQASSPTQRQTLYDWFTKTLLQRCEPQTSILIVGTRWHRDDLIGRLQREMESQRRNEAAPWNIIRLPALAEENDILHRNPGEPLWPELRPLSYLLERKAEVAPATWQGAYLCTPPTADGIATWTEEYIHKQHIVDELPPTDKHIMRVLALDPSMGSDAKKGDDSALVSLTLTEDKLLYVSADAKVRPPDVLTDEAIALCKKYQPHSFVIETNKEQIFYLRNIDAKAIDMGINLPLRGINNRINKEVRIKNSLANLLTTDPTKSQFRWVNSPSIQKLLDQLRDFPNGEHDDLLDALQMAIVRMTEMLSGIG